MPRWFIGCSGCSYRWWKGSFYSENCPPWKMLDEYAEKLKAIEINATFYRNFDPRIAYSWQKRTGDLFKFILKVPRTVSHEKQLNYDDAKLFKALCIRLGYHFQGALLQLPPSTEDPDIAELEKKIAALNVQPLFVEFRNIKWYRMLGKLRNLPLTVVAPFWYNECYNLLPKETLGHPNLYIRLHGSEKFAGGEYTEAFLRNIFSHANGGKFDKVYAFFNNDKKAAAPKNALMLQRIVNGF